MECYATLTSPLLAGTHQLSALILFLLSRSYLRVCLPSQSVSPRDRRASIIAAKARANRKFLTPKERVAAREEAANTMDDEDRLDWAERPQADIDAEAKLFKKKYGSKVSEAEDKWGGRRGMRREVEPRPSLSALRRNGFDPPNKRSRKSNGSGALFPGSLMHDEIDIPPTNGANTNGKSEKGLISEDWEELTDEQLEGWEVDPEAWLRVYYDPFDSHIRDDLIVSVVESTYSPMVGKIFRYILRAASEGEVPNMSDPTSKPLSIQALATHLPSDLKPSRCFDALSFPTSSRSSSSSSRQPYLAELLHILSVTELENAASALGPDGAGPGLVRLGIVAPAPRATANLAMASGGATFSSIQIQYAGAAVALRDRILRNVVRERYGTDAERVVCILLDKGKLEEKQLCKLAFLSVATTRELCARLFASSLLSLQEVPKTSDRAVSRTIFLWYVDTTRYVSWLVDRLCDARARISVAREEQWRRAKVLLGKLERSDVREAEERMWFAEGRGEGSEEGMLNDWERAERDALKDRLRALTVAEMRLDLDTFALTRMPLPPPPQRKDKE